MKTKDLGEFKKVMEDTDTEFEWQCYYCKAKQKELSKKNSHLRMEWLDGTRFRMVCDSCRIQKYGKCLLFESIDIDTSI